MTDDRRKLPACTASYRDVNGGHGDLAASATLIWDLGSIVSSVSIVSSARSERCAGRGGCTCAVSCTGRDQVPSSQFAVPRSQHHDASAQRARPHQDAAALSLSLSLATRRHAQVPKGRWRRRRVASRLGWGAVLGAAPYVGGSAARSPPLRPVLLRWEIAHDVPLPSTIPPPAPRAGVRRGWVAAGQQPAPGSQLPAAPVYINRRGVHRLCLHPRLLPLSLRQLKQLHSEQAARS